MKNFFANTNACWLAGLVFFFFTISSFGQISMEEYTKQFDQIIGEENLAINNGTLSYKDYPLVVEGKTKYFLNSGFSTGNVVYDGQQFYRVSLKYDLYLGLLIFNPQNASPAIGCNLIQQKVDSFTILDRNFVNMDKLAGYTNSEIQGYCQKIEIDRNLILYVKYKKSQRNVIKNNQVYHSFDLQHSFVLWNNGTFHPFSSAGDLQAIFPEHKAEIIQFHDQQKRLRGSDPVRFQQNLITYINGLSEN